MLEYLVEIECFYPSVTINSLCREKRSGFNFYLSGNVKYFLSLFNMKYRKNFVVSLYSRYSLYLWLFCLTSLSNIKSAESVFYTGKTDHSKNEMNRLNGKMTPRAAAIKCELDEECAGFTYHGPKTLWDEYEFQVTFY